MTVILALEDELGDLFGLTDLQPLKGGRTNKVWRSGDTVLKLYVSGSATPLFGNSSEHEWSALSRLNGHEIAPRPVEKRSTKLGTALIYKHISGDFGYGDVAEAASLLGRLHNVEAPTGLQHISVGEDVLSQGLTMISKGHPLHDLKPHKLGGNGGVFLHRDPVFSNFIAGPAGLRLVDWQCPGVGDPVEDLAHFVSPGMNLLYRSKTLDIGEIDRFLGHYPQTSVTDGYRRCGRSYHWRMACYCAWQGERGNAEYVPALKAEVDFLANWPF